ncbi:hypothetical protein H0H81_000593 [Sphagnurus paluster]|uniref:NCA2-domain-containing protein n=1 Tax=Sphagnurus paluster TaxID=117069 RepID=A0A9P7GGD0_9AGAR|nr:hypothetical protein H0H81_000593 [Sphagnurus paluster]
MSGCLTAMPSPFVNHFLKPLALSRPTSPDPSNQKLSVNATNSTQPHTKHELRSILTTLNQPLSVSLIEDTVGSLKKISSKGEVSGFGLDPETDALKQAITTKLLAGLYAEGIDSCLAQATNADTEAEWWEEIERSRLSVSWYLLQTSPTRLANLAHVILEALRTRNLPVSLSAFTPSSIRQLFPSTDPRRPNVVNKALFPHLHHQTLPITTTTILFSSADSRQKGSDNLTSKLWKILDPIFSLTDLPIELTRQECNFKRKQLEKIRDHRAEALGYLAGMRGDLALAIKDPGNIQPFVKSLTNIIEGDTRKIDSDADQTGAPPDPWQGILYLSTAVFTTQRTSYQHLLDSRQLLRPSRLTLIWPKLVLLPPLFILALRSAYASRVTLAELAIDSKATVEGFIRGWLIDPLKDVLRTVRAGGEDGVIVQKEAIAADFASLERMTLALAKDQLKYTPEQLASFSRQIKLGDLTPVLEIYEEDIKRPLKSAVTGTLLRSVFIQVQKAKVDIDQALSGIDKLLKSQELTFAFVGVAPAFGIVYLFGGSLVALWSGGRGKGKYGGKSKICGSWAAMRRIERLLISQPKSRHRDRKGSEEQQTISSTGAIPPLTAGLLLLSVARLRTYAETHLPLRSRLREGFLEDVGDLENPDLGRADKMRVVERMWRCWGKTLGWGKVASISDR